MFEQIFKDEVGAIATSPTLGEKLWAELAACYTATTRHYHNLTHLDNVIEKLLPIKNEVEDWQILVFSIAYHDIVYDTSKTDNEERSANFAAERLSELALSQQAKEKCQEQILFTKGHQVSDDHDTNYFTDADLSILGSNKNAYLIYRRQIREEYKLYPDFLYNPGRRKVLLEFLSMKYIFKTEYFRKKYEEQARINISMEIEVLF